MNIWLINPHDAIPGEPWGYKHGMILAETLAARGHKVTYWATNFAHATKQFRCHGWGEIWASPNIRILLVPVSPYFKHASAARIRSLWTYACGLWKRGRVEIRPNCLIISMPTPFSDYVAVKLSKRYAAALITDFRDLWPEIFATVFPRNFQSLAKVLLIPFYWSRRYAFKNSYAITAVCQTYLDLAHKIAPNTKGRPSAIIYSTGVRLKEFRALLEIANHEEKIAKKEGDVWAIYAGTLGNNYDIRTLMRAAKILSQNAKASNIKIIIAGDGPMRSTLLEFIEGHKLDNLLYLGVLDMPRLCRYYAKSDIGLCTYGPESTVVIPAKAFDYYAAELPIVNSLKGEFAEYLNKEGIGVQYEAGNPTSLANALLELSSSPKLRENMKKRLRNISPLFDCERQYSQFLNLLPQDNAK